VGLDVDVFGAVELFRPLDGEILDGVHMLAAAVVALTWVALRVLVRHDAPLGLHHRLGDVVLRCDHFEVLFLSALLAGDGLRDCRVGLPKMRVVHSHGLEHGKQKNK